MRLLRVGLAMIVYEPQPRWLPDILRLPVSYALRRALYGTLGIGTYAAVLIILRSYVLQIDIPHGATAFSVLGGVTTLALAFRMNNAYARWWEARLHWGTVGESQPKPRGADTRHVAGERWRGPHSHGSPNWGLRRWSIPTPSR